MNPEMKLMNENLYFQTIIMYILALVDENVSNILTFKSGRTFNPYLRCSTEQFDYYGNAPSLRQQCLRFLHFRLCSKILLPNQIEVFSDFRPQPIIIKYLKFKY